MNLAYRVDHFFIGVCAAIKDQIAGSGAVQERIAKMPDNLRFAKAPSVPLWSEADVFEIVAVKAR
jgi:hypothetical protein